MEVQSPFLRTGEAAKYLRISERTLETWRQTGRGPEFSRAGRVCLYTRRDLDDWVESRKVRSTSDKARGNREGGSR